MPTNPYSSVSISGYNSSSPPDDGSQTDANKITWAKHKDKLADPIKNRQDTIDTRLVTAFGKTINTDADENNAMGGSLALTEKIFTIASGAITPTRSNVVLAAESGTTDTLDSMATGSVADDTLMILSVDTGDTITINDAGGSAGQIHLKDSLDLDLTGNDRLFLIRDGADWYEIARSTVVDLTSVGIGNPDFTSTGQTVAFDTLLTVAHGLGAKPDLLEVVLRCTSGEVGYSVGDQLYYSSQSPTADNSVVIGSDATNIFIVQGVGIELLDKSGFNSASTTAAKWLWDIRAWK